MSSITSITVTSVLITVTSVLITVTSVLIRLIDFEKTVEDALLSRL